MTLRASILPLFVLVALASACRSKRHDDDGGPRSSLAAQGRGAPSASAKPTPKTPPGVKLAWTDGQNGLPPKVSLDGLDGAKGELRCLGLDCTLDLKGLPDGTKVKVGPGDEVASSSGTCLAKIDLGDQLGALSPHRAVYLSGDYMNPKELFDSGAGVVVTFPDGVKLEGKLPKLDVQAGLKYFLEEAAKNGRPVLFGKEADDPKAGHAILYAGVVSGDLVGDAKTMRDVSRIAVANSLPKRSGNKKCSGYKAAGEAGPGRELELTLVDYDVSLVERRTGKQLDHKKIEAPATCPMSALGDEATNYPDDEAVKAWLRTKL